MFSEFWSQIILHGDCGLFRPKLPCPVSSTNKNFCSSHLDAGHVSKVHPPLLVFKIFSMHQNGGIWYTTFFFGHIPHWCHSMKEANGIETTPSFDSPDTAWREPLESTPVMLVISWTRSRQGILGYNMMGDLLSKPSLKSTANFALLAMSQGRPEAHGSGPSMVRPPARLSVRRSVCSPVRLCICVSAYVYITC